MPWAPNPAALDLLDRAGPFESKAYRTACVAALEGTTDVSFAASTYDGATAAVALVRQGRTAFLPYGYSGVRASRSLIASEVRSFLDSARRESGAQRLIVYDVYNPAPGGEIVGTTAFAFLATPPTDRFAKRGRQSIRRALRSGASCETTADPKVFIGLYERASQAWRVSYPLDLIAATADKGVAHFVDVRIEGRPVGSLAVLSGVTDWMYWLAAQNTEGREAEVGYLAVAAMLEAAFEAGVDAVNL